MVNLIQVFLFCCLNLRWFGLYCCLFPFDLVRWWVCFVCVLDSVLLCFICLRGSLGCGGFVFGVVGLFVCFRCFVVLTWGGLGLVVSFLSRVVW